MSTLNTTVTLDKIAPKGRIGLISLATDFNIEQDLRRMLPEGFEIFTNRVKNANPATVENLRNIKPDIARAAGGILPGLGVDAVLYACTSGTAIVGEQAVADLVHTALPDIPVTNPFTAACKAFDKHNIKKISVLTPYLDEVNAVLKAQIESKGYEVLNIKGFNFSNDSKMTRISPASIHQAALEICHPEAEALFISCTALRASLVLEQIEKELGKMLLSSNQVSLWHLIHLLDPHTEAVTGYGQLLHSFEA